MIRKPEVTTERLIQIVREFPNRRVAVARRSRRRRVHPRRHRAHLARGAGPDPGADAGRMRPGRRRQRRDEPEGARRASLPRRRRRPRRDGERLIALFKRAGIETKASPRKRLRDSHQEPHPRRRRAHATADDDAPRCSRRSWRFTSSARTPDASSPIDAEKKGYFCPCHNASFDIEGKRLDATSSSPRDLDTLECKIEGSEVWVRLPEFPHRHRREDRRNLNEPKGSGVFFHVGGDGRDVGNFLRRHGKRLPTPWHTRENPMKAGPSGSKIAPDSSPAGRDAPRRKCRPGLAA